MYHMNFVRHLEVLIVDDNQLNLVSVSFVGDLQMSLKMNREFLFEVLRILFWCEALPLGSSISCLI